MIAPQTTVMLCNVPLDESQRHQIKFDSKAAQAAWFASKAVHSYSEFTFIRGETAVRVPANIDSLWNVNYCMYDNTNRWFYAFIVRMEYINENTTAVFLKTDVFQTWMLDVTMHPSFVEREHVVTDEIGEHTIEEGLETGEYISNTAEGVAGFGTMDIIIATTVKIEDVPDLFPLFSVLAASFDPVGAMYYGVYSGCSFYGTQDPEQASLFIKSFNVIGMLDAIIAVFMAPHIITGAAAASIALLDIPETGTAIEITTPSEPTTIDGYTPKNNKLLCFPYQYINISNNNGGQGVFRWERFQHITDNKRFKVIGGVAPGATYKILPKYQNTADQNYNSFDEAITLAGFPVCCFSGSSFQTYMAQNLPGMMLSAAGVVGGALTGNPIVAGGGIAGVLGQIGGVAGRAIQPPQISGNIGSGHANSSVNLNDFIISGKSIKAEYASIIDEYFSMYGYKVNQVKVPEVASRPKWNYIKTIDINITGAIPSDDMKDLKRIFNNGVTLWHDGANVGDYTLDNTIPEGA